MTSPFGKTGEERTGCYISKTIKMIQSMSLIQTKFCNIFNDMKAVCN